MRTHVWLAAGLLIALAASVQPLRAARGPSTPEERSTALKAIDTIERDPLGKDAKDSRSWLTMWLIEVPDISVKLCATFLGPVVDSKKNYSAEIVQQMMYASAGFVIQNPDKSKDDAAVYQAGVEGALRAYEAILTSKPKARWPFLDDLIKKRDAGQLRAFVDATMPECK